MNLDPNNWRLIKNGKAHSFPAGTINMRMRPGAEIQITSGGVQFTAYASLDGTFRQKVAEDALVEVESDGYIYHPATTICERRDEVFTNLDRRPSESGSVYEVTKALRLLDLRQLEHRREQAAIRERDRRAHEARLRELRELSAGDVPESLPDASLAPPNEQSA